MSSSQNNNFINTIPIVTRNILIINVIIWLACFVFNRMNIDLSAILGLHYPQAEGFYLYQYITYMFTHVEFTHLFFNMFALFMFGGTLEQTWGPKRYLIYYLLTGIGAALMQTLITYLRIRAITHGGDADIQGLYMLFNSVTIGASGSVFGILLAFGMLYPNVPLYIMLIPIPIKAKYAVIGYGLVELYLGVANYSGDNVAHFAHLGGMLFGILLIFYWRKKDKRNGHYH